MELIEKITQTCAKQFANRKCSALLGYLIIIFVYCALPFACLLSQQSHESFEELIDQIPKQDRNDSNLYIDSLLALGSFANLEQGVLHLEKGKNFTVQNKFKLAIEEFNLAAPIFKKEKNQKYLALNHFYLGTSYPFIDKKEEGIENLLIALEKARQLEDRKLSSKIFNSLAHVHYLYKDFEKAIDFTKQAAEIQSNPMDTLALSATYNNLAVIYKNTGKLHDAIEYNEKSLELNKLLNNEMAIAKSYNNIGLISEALGEFENAVGLYKKAIQLNEKIDFLNSAPLRNLGNYYLNINNLKEAKSNYSKALAIEEQRDKISLQRELNNVLLTISLKEKDFKNSLVYQKQKDSLYLLEKENENQEKFKLVENQYKLASREKELIQTKDLNKKNKLIFGILSSLILLSILFISQRNKMIKTELAKEKLVLEQTVLRSQMNPHFIFNVLSAIQNSLLDNNPIQSASYISRFAKLIRQNFDFINQNKITLREELDALRNYMDAQNLRFENKFEYEINVYPQVDIDLMELPPLLLQPFIENSIEHGFKNKKEKGKIELNISKEKNQLKFEVIDNGSGFSKKIKDGKVHAIDVFKKRLALEGKNEEHSFSITSNEIGTTINFLLKI